MDGRQTNTFVADRLREGAALLEAQGEDGFRVAAYRRAATTVDDLSEPVDQLFNREGLPGLEALPGIGRSIAAAIAEMVRSGHWSRLDRLRGGADPEDLFRLVPGIGPALAARLHDHLHIDTLEGLEAAAYDGHLDSVPGLGPRRAAMIRASLSDLLSRRLPRPPSDKAPPVIVLLDVDAEYRRRAAAHDLPTIAPRRMNPGGEAWLPILHTRRGDWHLTALFSNTPRAHSLGKVQDWVVLFYHTDDGPEGQATVVTETHGPATGQRVVRGREAECRALSV